MANNRNSADLRNQLIVSRYANGTTLEEIGDEVGLTRERVRQIVVKYGGPNAEAARRARNATKVARIAKEQEDFLKSYGQIASDIAHRGFARHLVISRMKTLIPAIDVELAESALKESDIVFNDENDADTFSNSVLEAGVWYLLSSHLGLQPDYAWTAVNLPQDMLEELAGHFTEASVSPTDFATILGMIGAAQRRAREDPSLTITGSRYNELRGQLLDAMGVISAKGTKPWPPTRQTIMRRYEGWNDALESMGLATAALGRPKGLLIFSEADYNQAVIDFIADSARSGTGQSYDSYGRWAKRQSAEGKRRPSPASVRNFYDGWRSALRIGPTRFREGDTMSAGAAVQPEQGPDRDATLERSAQVTGRRAPRRLVYGPASYAGHEAVVVDAASAEKLAALAETTTWGRFVDLMHGGDWDDFIEAEDGVSSGLHANSRFDFETWLSEGNLEEYPADVAWRNCASLIAQMVAKNSASLGKIRLDGGSPGGNIGAIEGPLEQLELLAQHIDPEMDGIVLERDDLLVDKGMLKTFRA